MHYVKLDRQPIQRLDGPPSGAPCPARGERTEVPKVRKFCKVFGLIFVAASVFACGHPESNDLRPRSLRHETAFEIDNQNWGFAKVYVLPEGGGIGWRLTTAYTGVQTTIRRQQSSRFRIGVSIFGNGSETWTSDLIWDSDVECLRIVVRNYLPHSYVQPC